MMNHTAKLALVALAITATMAVNTNATRAAGKSRDDTAKHSQKQLIITEAARMGIPLAVIKHVANKESTFQCRPGNPRYNGPLQISPASARALGYRANEGALNSCKAGLKYGLRHLALCVRKVGNNPHRAAMCHATPGRFGVVVRWRGA